MVRNKWSYLAVLFLFAPLGLFAQSGVTSRITSAVNESQRTVFKGNIHPLAIGTLDRGAAPDDLPMDRMILVLKRSPEQEADLTRLLDAQQNPASPSYHKWLSPEDFGRRFGPSDGDLAVVTSWLQARGFRVPPISKGRTVLEFSGTARQVREAFQTPIHKFVVNGEEHWANVRNPSIPAAMSPVVDGIASLHNFRARPMLRKSPRQYSALASGPLLNSDSGEHFLVPADYAVAYNINPLYQAGITGKGVTIAVVGPSNFDVQDVADFRARFGLTVNSPQVIVNGIDPGNSGGGGETEVLLDATWSGAIAPDATVKVVVSSGTDTTDGADLSEIYIVDNNLADVVTESLGFCEAYAGSSFTKQLSAVRQQAAAQGMTFIVSAGDGGLYGCDDFNTELSVSGPMSVNALASSPYTIAVGGTQFNENGNDSAYWSAADQKLTHKSLIAPIPETVWNESCNADLCFGNILAGSGGKSTVFTKPVWQAGALGIPNDQARDLPDVSLTASSHDGYVVCIEGSCQGPLTGGFHFEAVSGTSAAAPSFAGIMALINQKTGSRQGQANYTLYKLAALQNYSQCNGSIATAPAATCVFNDITTGNNAVPGQPGYGTAAAAYAAVVGYDRATGLGSINVSNLSNQWGSIGTNATTTTLSITPTTLIHGSAATVGIAVSAASGGGVPSGQVSLLTSGSQAAGLFQLNSGAVSGTTGLLPGGTYTVKAHYAGDGTFAPSDSTPASVVVSPEGSTVTLSAMSVDDNGFLIPFTSGPYGSLIFYSGSVAGQSGFGGPTGTVNLTDNSAKLVDNPIPLNSTGTFFLQPTDAPALGAHAVTGAYSGDGSFLASKSPAVSFTVQQAPTTSYLSPRCAPGPNPVTLELDLGTTSYGVAPTGTVTFTAGGKTLGAPAKVTGFASPGSVFAYATLDTSALPAGKSTVTATYSGDANYQTSSDTEPVFSSTETCLVDILDGAGYAYSISQDEIFTIFGNNLASSTALATSTKLPSTLADATVAITDSTGKSTPALLSYAGPGQINAVVPAGVHVGPATVQVTNKIGTDSIPFFIQRVAPGLFSADASGMGYAAANLVRITASGKQTIEPVVSVDAKGNITAVPIAFNGDRLVLVLYGTGIRQRSSLANTIVYFNGEAKLPVYAGAQNQYYGLDQLNIDLPPSLAGAGDVSIWLSVDGQYSNSVDVVFH